MKIYEEEKNLSEEKTKESNLIISSLSKSKNDLKIESDNKSK